MFNTRLTTAYAANGMEITNEYRYIFHRSSAYDRHQYTEVRSGDSRHGLCKLK